MKILAPTDFSALSKVAVLYAANLAAALKAQLIVLHVFRTETGTRVLSEFSSNEMVRRKKREMEEACLQLIADIREKIVGDLQAVYSVEEGLSVEKTINQNAKEYDCDLIIMGTKGATGLNEKFFGSNAVSVINNSSIAVLTIPEFAKYDGVKELAYATDTENLEDEMKELLPFARKFSSKIHVIHVHPPGSEQEQEPIKSAGQLMRQYNYPHVEWRTIVNADVTAGIENYVKDSRVDMLCVFSGKRNYYERLFKKSKSRKLVFHNHLPILTLSKNSIGMHL